LCLGLLVFSTRIWHSIACSRCSIFYTMPTGFWRTQMSATATRKATRKFRAVKVMTMEQLTAVLNCSERTAHRRLKGWNAISSCNRNGRYYTIPEVVEFDANGLWRFRGICFSRHGNLIETAAALIRSSKAGLTARELSKLLGMNAYTFISRFAFHPAVRREKLGGLYVYYCSSAQIKRQQSSARHQAGLPCRAALLSDAQAVLVLAEMIRCPGFGVEQLAHQLKTQGVDVDPAAIHSLLNHHGLAKGGAADSAECGR